MAERRMFQKSLLLADQFFDLSKGARILYITLCMAADDDGLTASVKSLMRQSGGSQKELAELVRTGYLIPFPSGVHAITHWKAHNAIRKDRHVPTLYPAELAQLTCTADGSYVQKSEQADNQVTTSRQPNDNQTTTSCQPSDGIGKVSLGQVSLGQVRGGQKIAPASATPPPEETSEQRYGAFQNVRLTAAEYQALAKRFPELDSHIENFSRKLAKHGYHYKSHALALEDYIMEDLAEERQRTTTPHGTCASTFDTDEFFAAALANSYGTPQSE